MVPLGIHHNGVLSEKCCGRCVLYCRAAYEGLSDMKGEEKFLIALTCSSKESLWDKKQNVHCLCWKAFQLNFCSRSSSITSRISRILPKKWGKSAMIKNQAVVPTKENRLGPIARTMHPKFYWKSVLIRNLAKNMIRSWIYSARRATDLGNSWTTVHTIKLKNCWKIQTGKLQNQPRNGCVVCRQRCGLSSLDPWASLHLLACCLHQKLLMVILPLKRWEKCSCSAFLYENRSSCDSGTTVAQTEMVPKNARKHLLKM